MVSRMCAVAALMDRTFAEKRVYDSDNTPLLDAIQNERKPYITVFTDNDTTEGIFGRDIYCGDHRMSVVFEFGIASAATVKNKGTVLNIPQTDQAMEALVDILESQIVAAVVSDPTSPFGEVFRQLVNKIIRTPSVRGGSHDRGTRWAARQLTLICDTIAAPAPGVVLDDDHPIRQFIAFARRDEFAALGMKEAADLVERVLNETASPDWRQQQAWLGLTEAGIRGTGVAPMPDGDEAGHPLTLAEPAFDADLTFFPPLEPDDG
ncbi:hypothetical protein CWO90_28480 [Bradyrhizobium sp. Leo121]|nr:hypothetical protein CWO90_28480 [Bradyrhizobium sp. Leo121]